MEWLLGRVHAVSSQTDPKDPSKSVVPEGDTADEFTQLKREINLHIRELRNAIRERDAYSQARGAMDDKAEIVRQSTVIRGQLNEVRAEAARLREMVANEDRKLASKGQPLESLDNRRRMCDLVEAHIEECDRWFKGLDFATLKNDPSKRLLLKGSQLAEPAPIQANFTPMDATETELEQIDGIEEWRLQIQANEEEIETRLGQLVEETAAIAHLTKVIGREYAAVGISVDQVDAQMTKTGASLEGANGQIEHVKQKLASKKNCCIDVFLFLIVLAVVGFLVWKYA